MSRLALVSILVGAAAILGRVPGILNPAKFREFMVKFPRAALPGKIIMGIVAAIVWYVMYNAATDEWKWAQPFILLGVPVAYWLVIQYSQYYLPVRALAAAMLLIAKQMVDAADGGTSQWRLVVTVLAYLWVIGAIWMTAAPHQFRDVIGYLMANDKRCRLACSAGIAVGVLLVGLGIFVY